MLSTNEIEAAKQFAEELQSEDSSVIMVSSNQSGTRIFIGGNEADVKELKRRFLGLLAYEKLAKGGAK